MQKSGFILRRWREFEFMSRKELRPEEQLKVSVSWEITHSVETNASPAFAWNYWTEVTNWDDPPAKFELDGPFACRSRGTTRLPGQEPLHWFIREVNPPHAATIEMQLQGATVSFNPTSAAESRFFTYWTDKSSRFNKRLAKVVDSDE